MALPDDIKAIVLHLLKPTRFYGFYPYQVVGFTGTRPDLLPVDSAYGMPSLKAIDRIPGFTGAAESYPIGTVVLVGFVGGDPGRPFVGFTQATTPTSIDVTLDVLGSRVTIRAAGNAVPLAKAGALNNYFTALETCLAAIVAALPTPAAVAGATATFQTAANAAKSSMATSRISAE